MIKSLFKKINLHIYVFFMELFSSIPGYSLGNILRKLFYSFYLKKMGGRLVTRKGFIALSPENIEIGNNVNFNNDCWLNGGGGITIQDNVIFGPRVLIHSSNHNFQNPEALIMDQGHSHKHVFIKNNVWVGANVTILPGVIINEGSVVAAGAVVTKEFPENSVIAGVPAKLIKSRV